MNPASRRRLNWLFWILLIGGLVLLAIGIVYFVVPASDLPSLLGSATRTTQHRTRRGTAMVILAGIAFVLAVTVFVARRRKHGIY
jgi:hypothetical protein